MATQADSTMRCETRITWMVSSGREIPKSRKIASNFGTMKYKTNPTMDNPTDATQTRYAIRPPTAWRIGGLGPRLRGPRSLSREAEPGEVARLPAHPDQERGSLWGTSLGMLPRASGSGAPRSSRSAIDEVQTRNIPVTWLENARTPGARGISRSAATESNQRNASWIVCQRRRRPSEDDRAIRIGRVWDREESSWYTPVMITKPMTKTIRMPEEREPGPLRTRPRGRQSRIPGPTRHAEYDAMDQPARLHDLLVRPGQDREIDQRDHDVGKTELTECRPLPPLPRRAEGQGGLIPSGLLLGRQPSPSGYPVTARREIGRQPERRPSTLIMVMSGM